MENEGSKDDRGSKKVGKLEKEVRWLKEREDMRKRRDQRNNIIIKGEEVPQTGEATKIVESIIKSYMDLDIKVTEARWIKGRVTRSKMIQARIGTWDDKKKVMEKK